MIGKSLIAAAVLAVAAAGTATAASAHSSHGYKRVVTVQKCIGSSKYRVRKVTRANGRRVVTKTRIGRCHNFRKHKAHRHHAHHHHHHAKSNRKAKRIVKRIFRKAFNN